MSYLRPVGQLTASVRVRGDYDTQGQGADAYISDAFIMDSVSQGYKEGYELLAEADPDRVTVVSSSTTSATTGSFPLPPDMWRLRAIDVYSGGQYFRVLRDDPSPLNSPWELPAGSAFIGTFGLPARYRLEGPNAFIAPAVPGNTTFRVTYIPVPTTLTSSLQTIDGTAGLDEFIVSWALRECRYREDKETDSMDRKLDRETKRIMRMGRDRDSGQPKRLEDPLQSRTRRGRWYR